MSRGPARVVRTDDFRENLGDPQAVIASHVCDMGAGPVLWHHGVDMLTGTIGAAGQEHGERIAIYICQRGCKCGCGAPGRGIIYTPDVAQARILAEGLLALADQMEAAAAEQAQAALRKASSK